MVLASVIASYVQVMKLLKLQKLLKKNGMINFSQTRMRIILSLVVRLCYCLRFLADAAALEEKVLVFSHSLISLDVIEMALGGGEIGGNSEDWCRGCDYFRMDGSTSAQMRKRWADIFNDEENRS